MNKVILLRSFFFLSVFFSLFTIYYANVVRHDFHVFTNPEGPDTSDYFLIETETYE